MPIHLLFDQNLTSRIVVRLRALEIASSHVRERGLLHARDEAIFARARAEGWTIVTADADLTGLAVASGSALPSVIHVRCARPYDEEALADRLRSIVLALSDDLRSGAVVSLKDGSGRVRRLRL